MATAFPNLLYSPLVLDAIFRPLFEQHISSYFYTQSKFVTIKPVDEFSTCNPFKKSAPGVVQYERVQLFRKIVVARGRDLSHLSTLIRR